MPLQQDMTKPGLFTFEEAAKYLGGISPWTLRRQAQRQNLKVVHLGLKVFITLEELDRIRHHGLPPLTPE
jgi:hypothetical protein